MGSSYLTTSSYAFLSDVNDSVEHRLVGNISASLTAGSVLRIVGFASRLP